MAIYYRFNTNNVKCLMGEICKKVTSPRNILSTCYRATLNFPEIDHYRKIHADFTKVDCNLSLCALFHDQPCIRYHKHLVNWECWDRTLIFTVWITDNQGLNWFVQLRVLRTCVLRSKECLCMFVNSMLQFWESYISVTISRHARLILHCDLQCRPNIKHEFAIP